METKVLTSSPHHINHHTHAGTYLCVIRCGSCWHLSGDGDNDDYEVKLTSCKEAWRHDYKKRKKILLYLQATSMISANYSFKPLSNSCWIYERKCLALQKKNVFYWRNLDEKIINQHFHFGCSLQCYWKITLSAGNILQQSIFCILLLIPLIFLIPEYCESMSLFDRCGRKRCSRHTLRTAQKKAPSVRMIDILMCGIWWQQSAEAVVSGLQIIQSSNHAMHQSKLTYVQVTFQSITFIKRAVWWRLWWL